MTTSIKSLSDGLSGELQVNGNPALRFQQLAYEQQIRSLKYHLQLQAASLLGRDVLLKRMELTGHRRISDGVQNSNALASLPSL